MIQGVLAFKRQKSHLYNIYMQEKPVKIHVSVTDVCSSIFKKMST